MEGGCKTSTQPFLGRLRMAIASGMCHKGTRTDGITDTLFQQALTLDPNSQAPTWRSAQRADRAWNPAGRGLRSIRGAGREAAPSGCGAR